jgi:hypothetical protein
MGFMEKVKSWWRKDDLAQAEEETRMTPRERDEAEEDYEGQKDDIEAERGGGLGTMPPVSTDFEADSEPPR